MYNSSMNTHSPSDFRIFVDTEYCYPGMKKLPRPTAADQRQIVQIAAVLYDCAKNAEIAAFDMLATPSIDDHVTPFFEELTGITQADIDKKASEFPVALELFRAFCADYPIWTFDKDQAVFEQNCAYFSIRSPFHQPFTRVKALLPEWHVDPSKYSSGTLYKAAGIDMEGHVHNALHDVRSMAAVCYFERLVAKV
jgi:inhibitor of KinA sporulation pathway (predicted exonuclease)